MLIEHNREFFAAQFKRGGYLPASDKNLLNSGIALEKSAETRLDQNRNPQIGPPGMKSFERWSEQDHVAQQTQTYDQYPGALWQVRKQ